MYYAAHPDSLYNSASTTVSVLPPSSPRWESKVPSVSLAIESDGFTGKGNSTVAVGSQVLVSVNVSIPQGTASGSSVHVSFNSSSTIKLASIDSFKTSIAPAMTSSVSPFDTTGLVLVEEAQFRQYRVDLGDVVASDVPGRMDGWVELVLQGSVQELSASVPSAGIGIES